MSEKAIGVAIAGLGTIGSGVAHVIQRHSQETSAIRLVGFLEKNKEGKYAKDYFRKSPELFIESLEALLNNPEVDIIVETIGGRGFARELIIQALKKGKHVVTANKDLLATHGRELLALAKERQRTLLFEASVAGAIPILRLLEDYFSSQDILEVLGIVNGTTNYILSEMDSRKIPFDVALQQAQEKGFAEQDPTNDIKGYDARYKLVILTYLITQNWLDIDQITVEGIDQLDTPDFEYADRMGKKIKLLACLRVDEKHLEAFVLPLMLPKDHTLAKITGSTNIVTLKERHADEISLIGKGAGSLPTATAIMADIYKIANNSLPLIQQEYQPYDLQAFSEYVFKHTLRFEVRDRPGIVGNIGRILEKYSINIYALEQLPQYHHSSDSGENDTVIFTLTLEACKESLIENAVQEINQADYMVQPVVILRELNEL